MRENNLAHLKDGEFKRLTGVKRDTFEKMRAVIESKAANFGRPPKLSCGDQLLMTLMYWREYRTQFHMALIRPPETSPDEMTVSCGIVIDKMTQGDKDERQQTHASADH